MRSVPTKSVWCSTCVAGLLLQVACTDFATPAELDRPQLLAIVADPPAVSAGERSALSLVVAGPGGEVDDYEAGWRAVPTVPETPPLGRMEIDDSGAAWYVAPDSQPADDPALAVVEASVSVDGSESPLVGTKALAVGTIRLRNPTISRFTGGGDDLFDAPLTIAVGAEVELAVDIEGGIPAMGSAAWYSSVGEIELYRSTPTSIRADDPGEGWLFVVVRDGAGGVAWRKTQIRAE